MGRVLGFLLPFGPRPACAFSRGSSTGLLQPCRDARLELDYPLPSLARHQVLEGLAKRWSLGLGA